jgi:hypothetical protein
MLIAAALWLISGEAHASLVISTYCFDVSLTHTDNSVGDLLDGSRVEHSLLLRGWDIFDTWVESSPDTWVSNGNSVGTTTNYPYARLIAGWRVASGQNGTTTDFDELTQSNGVNR